jgi:hypothetical protein
VEDCAAAEELHTRTDLVRSDRRFSKAVERISAFTNCVGARVAVGQVGDYIEPQTGVPTAPGINRSTMAMMIDTDNRRRRSDTWLNRFFLPAPPNLGLSSFPVATGVRDCEVQGPSV